MDWGGLKAIAFGPLNLSHDEFWELTWAEFDELIDGFKQREKLAWMKVAQLAVWTSQTLKKGTTADKLISFLDGPKKKTNAEETKKVINSLIEEMG